MLAAVEKDPGLASKQAEFEERKMLLCTQLNEQLLLQAKVNALTEESGEAALAEAATKMEAATSTAEYHAGGFREVVKRYSALLGIRCPAV